MDALAGVLAAACVGEQAPEWDLAQFAADLVKFQNLVPEDILREMILARFGDVPRARAVVVTPSSSQTSDSSCRSSPRRAQPAGKRPTVCSCQSALASPLRTVGVKVPHSIRTIASVHARLTARPEQPSGPNRPTRPSNHAGGLCPRRRPVLCLVRVARHGTGSAGADRDRSLHRAALGDPFCSYGEAAPRRKSHDLRLAGDRPGDPEQPGGGCSRLEARGEERERKSGA